MTDVPMVTISLPAAALPWIRDLLREASGDCRRKAGVYVRPHLRAAMRTAAEFYDLSLKQITENK